MMCPRETWRPTMAISQRLTLEEFLQLPEKKPALEYEDGRVTQKVSPQGKHSTLQAGTVDLFDRFTVPRKLAKAFPELRTTFGGYSRVPDVSVYLWDRIPLDASGEVADEFFIPPDIAVEILSPEQRVNALVRRCSWYVAQGVRAALLLTPADHSVRFFRPGHEMTILRADDRIDLQDVLPGFEVTVQDLFAPLIIR
jgi:Uma2 family endonuclease